MIQTSIRNKVMYIAFEINFRTYTNILRRSILEVKHLYYNILFEKYKYYETWATIKDTLSKTNQRTFRERLIVANTIINNPTQIAEEFNKYFSNIGPTVASQIQHNINLNI